MTGPADLRVGQPVTVWERPVTRLDLAAYCLASGDRNPIHWSDDAAQRAGLPGVIAHGMLTMGLVSRAVIAWAGEGARLTTLSCRFARPLVVPGSETGAPLTVAVTLRERAGDRLELDLDVTSDGDPLLSASRAAVHLPQASA